MDPQDRRSQARFTWIGAGSELILFRRRGSVADALSSFAALTSLSISTSAFDEPTAPPPPAFPILKHLHIHNCHLSPATCNTLSRPDPRAFPWEDNRVSPADALAAFPPPLTNTTPSILNSLLTFSPLPGGARHGRTMLLPPQFPDLLALSTSWPPPDWLAKNSLVLLNCWASDLTERTIPHLPSSLRIVRPNLKPEDDDEMALDSFLEALRVNIVVAKEWELRVPMQYLELERWEEFKAGCEAIGVKLEIEHEDEEDEEDAPFDVGFWRVVDEVEQREGRGDPSWGG